jgi:hypothetical protein
MKGSHNLYQYSVAETDASMSVQTQTIVDFVASDSHLDGHVVMEFDVDTMVMLYIYTLYN